MRSGQLHAMRVLNVHEREIPASAAEAARLLNSLSSDDDLLWPKKMWPPMRLDRPLGVGASGGHGPVRYIVEEFSPGQSVKFRFTGPAGFSGWHRFDLLPGSERCSVLRHTLDMKARGAALLSWPLVFRPLHDALLEDSLALAQAALGAVPEVRPWSSWVRFLRWVFSSGKARRQHTPIPSSQ
jgi:hypothetical protein